MTTQASTATQITRQLLDADNAEHCALVQSVMDGAPQFHLLVEGHIAGPNSAREDMLALPPGKRMADKFYFLFRDPAGQPVGICDVVRAYPIPSTLMVGLLEFRESAQGKGYGAQALQQLRDFARECACDTLRIGVVEHNLRALAFWQREGFVQIERKTSSQFTGDVLVLQLSL